MPSKRQALCLDALGITTPILQAKTAQTFVDAVRDGYMALYERLLGKHDAAQRGGLDELDAALAGLSGRPRAQRLLALCAWPLLDKPGVDVAAGEPPQFLWLFAVPFVVTFEAGALLEPLVLPNESFDAGAFLVALSDSGIVNDAAELGVLSNLFRREDLQAQGPRQLASEMVKAEAGEPHALHPLPLVLDESIESGRALTMFALCVARLPVTERQLFERSRPWPADDMARQMHGWLRERGLPVHSVLSSPPCSLAEVQFLCKGAGVLELRRLIELGEAHYGLASLCLRFPMDGLLELYGLTRSGEEVLLAPPLGALEPREELAATVQHLARERGLTFKGAYSLATPAGTTLQ